MKNQSYTTTPCGVYITNLSQKEIIEREMKCKQILFDEDDDFCMRILQSRPHIDGFHAWVYDKKRKLFL